MRPNHNLAAFTAALAAFAILVPAAHAGTLASVTATVWHQHHPAPRYKPARLQYMAADNEQCTAQDTIPLLRQHHANVLRYIVSFNPTETYLGVPCTKTARAAGYRTYLSIAFPPAATPAQDAGYFAHVLAAYGHVWAVAVGNEDPVSPHKYLRIWTAVRPVLNRLEPHALLVGGDAVPWALKWSERVIAAHPSGMDAYAFHCYVMAGEAGLIDVPELAAYARAHRIPLWCSEMAPATAATTPNFLMRQTLDAYNAEVARTLRASLNLQMRAYYVWPSIGAN